MAKARITLNDSGPLTYHGGGYDLERGQSIVTTKDEDIIHFSTQPGFTVDMLEGDKPKAVTDESADEEEEAADSEDGDTDEEAVDGKLSLKDLKKQSKQSLLQLAEERGVKADNSMKVADIIKALLADQDKED